MRTLEQIGEMLVSIGRRLGATFVLDDRGTLTLSYAGDRICVLAVHSGFYPRIGMLASLIPAPTDDQIARALRMNATLGRETGVLALDDQGALVLTSAREAQDLSEKELAAFMGDFMKDSIELKDALRARTAAGNDAPPRVAGTAILC
jgi:hypothetical protein